MRGFLRRHPGAALLVSFLLVAAILGGWVFASYLLGSALGDYRVLGWLAGLASFLGLAVWSSLRRHAAAQRAAQQPRAELDALDEWAQANGWTVEHLGHPGLTDDITRIELLTDNAGWGHGTTGDQRTAGTNDWAFGGAIARQTASGRLVVLGGYRYRDRRLWAALATNATTSDVTWDLIDDGRVEQSGPTPALEDGEPIANLFVGFDPITRLRIIRNQLLLCVPGRFEPETLTRIADRLTALERRLPRPPGTSPQR